MLRSRFFFAQFKYFSAESCSNAFLYFSARFISHGTKNRQVKKDRGKRETSWMITNFNNLELTWYAIASRERYTRNQNDCCDFKCSPPATFHLLDSIGFNRESKRIRALIGKMGVCIGMENRIACANERYCCCTVQFYQK